MIVIVLKYSHKFLKKHRQKVKHPADEKSLPVHATSWNESVKTEPRQLDYFEEKTEKLINGLQSIHFEVSFQTMSSSENRLLKME